MELSSYPHTTAALSQRAQGSHWIIHEVGFRAALDLVVKTTISAPAGNKTPVINPIASRYTD